MPTREDELLTNAPTRVVTASAAPLAIVPACERPDVSFVAVAYGTGPIIVESIRSLVDSLSDSGVAYEYVVVDNAHPDVPSRTRNELLLSTAGVVLLTPGSNLGFGGGCEHGALATSGDVLAFVNPDVFFEPGWIAPLSARLDAEPDSIVAPVLLEPDGSVQEAGQIVYCDGSTGRLTERFPTANSPAAEYSSAACWLMQRDVHERVGGFDPAFHPAYFEDVDFVRRLALLGGRCVVVGESTVVHRRGSSTTSTAVPDIRPQRAELLRRWPEIRWTKPPPQRFYT